MAAVKWIKIVTDLFDDEKMLLIESLPSADSIIVVWFKLLCLAGKTNNSGVFIFNDRIPYTEEMLASIFRRDINTVRLALQTFTNFGMVEIIDNVITIPNWGKHQTLDAYERQKEKDRLKKKQARADKKALILSKSGDASGDAYGDSPRDVPTTEKEEDIERELDDIPKGISNKKGAADKPQPPTLSDSSDVFGSLSPRMVVAIEKWLQYKNERREGYKPTGLRALISQIENNVNRYGEDAVISLISESMASNWKGIIFEKLKNQRSGYGNQGGRGNIFAEMLNEGG